MRKNDINKTRPTLHSRYNTPNIKGELFHCGASIFLNEMETNSASIIFLDPPFNLGKDYGNGKKADRKPHGEYLSWLINIIRECKRILKPGGALYLYHLPGIATQLTVHLNEIFQFRHWIAISMKNTFVRGNWLYPAHYALLYYTKGKPLHFNRPKLEPQKCRHCAEYIKDYGGYKHIIEEKGINLSDIWDDISPIRHNNTKTRIANELPFKLLNRIISISGLPGETYIDPFAGGGNGIIAAVKGGMHFKACDNSKKSCNTISAKVHQLLTETEDSLYV